MRALSARNLRRLAAASGLPLLVRYPGRYAKGRIVEYALDSQATDAVARDRLLGQFLTHFPFPSPPYRDEDTGLAVLGHGSHADVAKLPDGSARIRFCEGGGGGDGTYDRIELTLRRDRSGSWQVHAVEDTWFQHL
jgi:hypothetical protein